MEHCGCFVECDDMRSGRWKKYMLSAFHLRDACNQKAELIGEIQTINQRCLLRTWVLFMCLNWMVRKTRTLSAFPQCHFFRVRTF
jgi:hypothetical protein